MSEIPVYAKTSKEERGAFESNGGIRVPMHRIADETIHITNLTFQCIIGVNPEERTTEQPLVVTAAIRGDFTRAAATDDLKHTVDYSDVAKEIQAFSRAGRFRLLETLVRRLAVHLSDQFRLTDLTLYIRKPNALAGSDGPAVSLHLTASPEMR